MKNTHNDMFMEERSNLRILRSSLQPDGKAKLQLLTEATDDEEEMPDCCLVYWDEFGMWTWPTLTEDD